MSNRIPTGTPVRWTFKSGQMKVPATYVGVVESYDASRGTYKVKGHRVSPPLVLTVHCGVLERQNPDSRE